MRPRFLVAVMMIRCCLEQVPVRCADGAPDIASVGRSVVSPMLLTHGILGQLLLVS